MLIASIPTKIPVPFANSAVAPYVNDIPVPSQVGVTPGRASYTTGFVPVNFTAIEAGGIPPFGGDFNGLMRQTTQWLRWLQAGAPIAYDATFQSDIGGYPLGAFIFSSQPSTGFFYFNTVDGNTSNPDTGGSGWTKVDITGVLSTGAWTWRPTQETIPGWVKANGYSIGNVGSGAQQFASALAAPLFSWLWTNFSNSQCPVLPGGRGANPTADFAALKTIAVVDMKGMFPIGMDTMGGDPSTRLSGVPVTSGSATQAGSVLGEVLHALITAELAAHNHGITDTGHIHAITDPTHNHGITDLGHFHQIANNAVLSIGTTFSIAGGTGVGPGTSQTDTKATGITINGNGTGISVDSHATGISVNNSGSNTPHNNTGLSMTGTHYFKL